VTLEELDQKYPNGLNDTKVTSLVIDYRSRTAMMHLSMRGNPPDSPDSQGYAPATLSIKGFWYISIEPPDPDHVLGWNRSAIQVDGFPEDPKQFPLFERVKSELPAGAFSCRLFVHDWNSFIHIAGQDAELSWLDDVDGGEEMVQS
jgi:hypothetical protein